MKFSKLNSSFKKFEEQENSNLTKVEIVVQHDGLNKNNSIFKLENIKKAEHTLKNIPILGYIKRDNGDIDFDHHNMETKLIETDNGYELKVEYLESPVGVIPSDTKIKYEEIDGRTYLICYGYIWSNYCSDAIDIINKSEQKKVSMEISVDSYSLTDDGYVDIEDYQFLGITILGDHIESGMHDTVMTKYSVCADYKDALADIYKEIYSLERREDNMEEVREEVVVETQHEAETLEVEETQATEEVIEEEIVEDAVEEVVEEEEKEVEVVEETEATEDVVEVEETLDVFADILGEVPQTLKEAADMITEKFSTMNDELKTLREFKSNIDLEELKCKVEEISNKYDLDVDTTELKEKAIAKDMTLEQFEKELKVLFAEKVLENGKFSKEKKEETTKVVISSHEECKTVYGGLFEKHGLK